MGKLASLIRNALIGRANRPGGTKGKLTREQLDAINNNMAAGGTRTPEQALGSSRGVLPTIAARAREGSQNTLLGGRRGRLGRRVI